MPVETVIVVGASAALFMIFAVTLAWSSRPSR